MLVGDPNDYEIYRLVLILNVSELECEERVVLISVKKGALTYFQVSYYRWMHIYFLKILIKVCNYGMKSRQKSDGLKGKQQNTFAKTSHIEWRIQNTYHTYKESSSQSELKVKTHS